MEEWDVLDKIEVPVDVHFVLEWAGEFPDEIFGLLVALAEATKFMPSVCGVSDIGALESVCRCEC
jgi:hypothetical protein